jgi:phospholipid/cholesterol/gamma-HCH transport system permease protein
VRTLIGNAGRWFIGAVSYVGWLAHFVVRMLAAFPHVFRGMRRTSNQMLDIGVHSLPLIALTSLFTGAVATWQAAYQFENYVPLRFLGGAVGKAIMIELGPVLTSLVVAGRVGASIAAELGTMRVTEQIDALEVMGIDPVGYLVWPRVLAGVIMLPVLVLYANTIAMLGALAVAAWFVDITTQNFMNSFRLFFVSGDLYAGLTKAAIFGLIITLIGCVQGFNTRGGAEGVGRATTSAVVIASVLILVSDYLIATLLFQI